MRKPLILAFLSLVYGAAALAAPTVTMWASGEKEYFHPGTNYINQNVDVGYYAVVGAGGSGLSCTTKNTSGYGTSLTGVKRVDTFTSSTAQTKTYEVTCTDSTGSTTKTQSVTWSALPAAPTVSATVTPTTYYFDEDTTYAWTVSNAYSCAFKAMHRNDADTGWLNHTTETFFPTTKTHLSGSGVIRDKSWFMSNGNNKYRYKLECTNAGGTTTVNKDVTYANRPVAPVASLIPADSATAYYNGASSVGLLLTASGADSCVTDPGDFASEGNVPKVLNKSGTAWIPVSYPGAEGWKTYKVLCKENAGGLTTVAQAQVYWRTGSTQVQVLDYDREVNPYSRDRFVIDEYGMCGHDKVLTNTGVCATRVAKGQTADLTFMTLNVSGGTSCTRSNSINPTAGTWAPTTWTSVSDGYPVTFTVSDNSPADTSVFDVSKRGYVWTFRTYTLTCNGVSKTIPIVFN